MRVEEFDADEHWETSLEETKRVYGVAWSLAQGHLRILGTRWLRDWWAGGVLCPFCYSRSDSQHDRECTYLASMVVMGLADEPKGDE